jgi:hypothetical protein
VCRTYDLTTFMCRLSGNRGSLNLVQPYGPVQACNGIALPFVNIVSYPSIHGNTAPSGPWRPSKVASILPYFPLFSSILVSLISVMCPSACEVVIHNLIAYTDFPYRNSQHGGRFGVRTAVEASRLPLSALVQTGPGTD